MPTCQGFNKDGTPCENRVQDGVLYCYHHKPSIRRWVRRRRWGLIIAVIVGAVGFISAALDLRDRIQQPTNTSVTESFPQMPTSTYASLERLETQSAGYGTEAPRSTDAAPLTSTAAIGNAPGTAIEGGPMQVSRYELPRAENFILSPQAMMIATPAGYGIRLWRLEDGVLLRTLLGQEGVATNLAFSPDWRMIAAGTDLRTIVIWNVSDGELIRTLAGIWKHSYPGTGWVLDVEFSPDGEFVAGGGFDGTARVWRVADGEVIKELENSSAEIISVVDEIAFSPDGSLLTAASGDDVLLWRTRDWSLHSRLVNPSSVQSVAFSPDGLTLAVGHSAGPIRLINVSDGQLLGVLEGHTDKVKSLDYSPDGEFLASGASDKSVRFWRMSDLSLMATLRVHEKSVRQVSFTHDGRGLLSASYDDVLILWDVGQ